MLHIEFCVQGTAEVGAHEQHSKLDDQRVSTVCMYSCMVSLKLMLTWVARVKVNYCPQARFPGTVFMFWLKN